MTSKLVVAFFFGKGGGWASGPPKTLNRSRFYRGLQVRVQVSGIAV